MRVENDREIFDAGYPGIVPFLMTEYKGDLTLEVYSGAVSAANDFLSRFKGRFFTKDALSSIARSLDGYLQDNGYERDTVGETLYYYQYELTPEDTLDPSLIKENTKRLTPSLYKRLSGNLTTFSLEELLEKRLESFVVIEEGRAVAIATVNERLEAGGMPEITVETSPRYRSRGYAASTVTALCQYLLKKGVAVAYCCRNTHTKSNKVARRVGFKRVGRFYAVAAYRIHTER